MESGWNRRVWLVGVVSSRWVWPVGGLWVWLEYKGVVSVCSFKEVTLAQATILAQISISRSVKTSRSLTIPIISSGIIYTNLYYLCMTEAAITTPVSAFCIH